MTVRVGILGGTFDPIHLGHLEAASAARRALSLDRLLLLPSRTPPHRSIEPRASVFHRFAMAALAAAECDMSVSDLEVRRDGPSNGTHARSASSRRFRAGGVVLHHWKRCVRRRLHGYDYPRILQLANFVIVSRPGAPAPSALIPNPQSLTPNAPKLLSVEATTPDVSSTDIRRRVGAGESIDGLVPSSVAGHIRRHHLYVPAPVAAVL